ncbi:hypothetical protein RRG08_063592 [Elysia crispata]|uniref:Uncharacterized protein n=1 Tax=Elysia crispata TaxID=231223 RepID=A0AAE0YRN6_9GAST|nr:hypothetical protein RRG08_063592 [Elysia crispata]
MLESQIDGPVYFVNKDGEEASAGSGMSMFDTSRKRKVSSNSRIDVRSHKPDREDEVRDSEWFSHRCRV